VSPNAYLAYCAGPRPPVLSSFVAAFSLGVLAWAAADAIDGPLVVAALGVVVGAIPDAVAGGMSSRAGHPLIGALIIAAAGTHEDLMTAAGRYAELFTPQASGYR
jgi:hypothetical protein